jgi:hypothetical protein
MLIMFSTLHSILVGALIVGLAFLIPSTSLNGWVKWIIIDGLVANNKFGNMVVYFFISIQKRIDRFYPMKVSMMTKASAIISAHHVRRKIMEIIYSQ